ncbi:MAG TPA: hypothetical protein VGM98_06415 [Schlesneria sp.]
MFDPYRKWLGITAKDLPPNHYRLLGLENFESDLDVIEGAADRQMGFIRQYQSGEHSTDAAKILNELAIARLCLLKPATKAAYDAKLRNELEPPEEDISFDLPLPNAISPSRRKRASAKRKSKNSPQLIIGGGLGLVVCLVLAMFLFSGSRKKPEKLVEAEKPITQANNATETKPTVPVSAIPLASSVLWSEPVQSVQPVGATIDLLKSVKIPENVIAGEWQQTSTALIGSTNSNIYLPVKLPEDYQLKYSIRRLEGADTIFLGFVMAGRPGMIVLDGWNAEFSGLCVDGREPSANCTTLRARLFSDQAAEVAMTVHPGHLHVALDGKTIIDWHGNPQRLQLQFAMAYREAPFIAISQAKYVIESAKMIPLKPETSLKRIGRLDREVEVIPLMDIDRDAQRGIWGLSKGNLSSPDNHGLIYLPTVVPEEYTLSMTAELRANHQGGHSFGIGLVTGDDYVQFHATERGAGLDIINGRRFSDGETRVENQWFKPGVPVQVRCTVTKEHVVVDVNDRTFIDWHGDFRQFAMAGDWALRDARRLFVGAAPHFKFRDIKLGPPIKRAKLPEIPAIGKSTDLLALIDPKRDALTGIWEREGNAIRTLADVMRSKLVVPFEPPADYKLTIKVAREPGGTSNDQAFFVNLPTAGEKCIVAFDASGKTVSGCSIDGTDLHSPPLTWRGVAIDDGLAQELTCIVRGTGIKVLKGDQTILDWTGNPNRFEIESQYQTPGNKIGLISWNSRFRIEKLELETLAPAMFPATSSTSHEGDLLQFIDTARDSRFGEWKSDGDGLINLTSKLARLQISGSLPDRYTLEMDIERTEGDNGLVIGLPMMGHPCTVAIDHFGGKFTGLSLVDGKHVNDSTNLTRRQHSRSVLPKGQRVKIQCWVTPASIVAKANDIELVRWHGDPRRLSLLPFLAPPGLESADQPTLWIGLWDSVYRIRAIQLKPMTDDDAKSLDAEFEGVYPTSPQPDIVIAATVAPATPTNPKPETTVAKPKKTSNLLPAPAKADLDAARAKVMKSFGGELKLAQDVDAKLVFATKLMTSAANLQEPSVDRFANFTEAMEIYSNVGDLMSAFRAIDTMKATFDITSLEEKSELLQRIAKKAKTPLQNRYIVFVALKLAADAVADENYPLAKEACGKAVTAARAAADPKVQAHAVEQSREIDSLLSQYRAAKLAEGELRANPNDATANTKVGEYRCWVRRDWETGLVALRHTSDTRLQPIVTADLANPTTPDAQATVAQSWLNFAKGQKVDVVKEAAAERAATWFEKAIPGLSANKKASAEAEVDLAYELASGRDFKKLLSRPANGVEATSSFDCRTEMHAMKLKPSFEFGKSWMLSLQFKPANLDGGWHQIFFWGDGAGGDDPLWVRIDGTRLSAVIENVIENRGQGIDYYVPGSLQGEWIDLKFIYDAVGGNLELYINHRLIRSESLAVIPAIDRGMPMYDGGADGETQRFHGYVRNIWLGNIQ